MADTKLKLEVIMAAVDRITRPLKAVLDGSKATSTQVKALRDKLKDLNSQAGQIEAFRKLQSQTAVVGHNMAEAQAKVKKLAQEIKAAESPTKALTRDFEDAKKEANKLTTQHQEMTQRVQRQRDALNNAGLSTKQLAGHQRSLKGEIGSVTSALEAEQKKLEAISQRASKIRAAQAQANKAKETAGKLATNGAASGATGGATLLGLNTTIGKAAEYQQEIQKIKALGMGDHVVADADKFARGMKVYGTSMHENIDMMRDGLSIFADLHHAEMALPVMQKMKYANAALYGQAAGDEKTQQLYDMLKVVELRGGAKDANTFKAEAELIQKVMSSTGGRVGSKDYRELIQTGGVSAKQLSTDVFYNTLEPMIQEMGGHQVGTGLMSAFQNLYLGKSTTAAARTLGDLGLLNSGMVEYDKIGQIKRMKTGAIIGGETYKSNPFEWLETHFLPALAKKGITDPSKVRDMLATVVGNRTGAKVLSTYLDQKEQINRAAGRNRGAYGIDQTYDTAKDSPEGKKIALEARFEDVQKIIGDSLLPGYTKLLELLTKVTDAVGNFAEKHPTLVSVMGYTAAAIGGLLLVFGGLAVAVAAVLGPFAMARMAMAGLGIGLGTAKLPSAIGLFTRLRGAITWVWRAGTFLLRTNPVMAAIIGIGFALSDLLSRWDQLKALFNAGKWAQLGLAILQGVEVGLNAATFGLYGLIKSIALGLWDAFKAVLGINSPSRVFAELGGFIVDGLIVGITSKWEQLKTATKDMASNVAKWFAEKTQINSPSRVFLAFGGHIVQGLQNGIEDNAHSPIKTVQRMAEKLAAVGAGMSIGAGAIAAPVTFDTRPPLASAAAASAAKAQTPAPNVNITINATPGMDERALARLVAAEIEKATRQSQSAKRSRLTDSE